MDRKALLFTVVVLGALAGTHALLVPSLSVAAEEEARVTGRFLLVTHDGQRVTDAAFQGKLRLMTFGYTYCPDICPTTLGTMAAALDKLGAKADQIHPMFVTVDPQRDTPQHLGDYVKAFGPTMIGLTGTPEMVAAAARQFKVIFERHKPADGSPDSYMVDHSAGIYIMDREGGFLARLPHTATADEVAARLMRYVK